MDLTAGESAPRNMDVSTSFRLVALEVVERLEVDRADPTPLLAAVPPPAPLAVNLGMAGGGGDVILSSLVRPLMTALPPVSGVYPVLDLGVGMSSCSTRSALRRVSVTPNGVVAVPVPLALACIGGADGVVTGGGGPELDGDDAVLVRWGGSDSNWGGPFGGCCLSNGDRLSLRAAGGDGPPTPPAPTPAPPTLLLGGEAAGGGTWPLPNDTLGCCCWGGCGLGPPPLLAVVTMPAVA